MSLPGRLEEGKKLCRIREKKLCRIRGKKKKRGEKKEISLMKVRNSEGERDREKGTGTEEGRDEKGREGGRKEKTERRAVLLSRG